MTTDPTLPEAPPARRRHILSVASALVWMPAYSLLGGCGGGNDDEGGADPATEEPVTQGPPGVVRPTFSRTMTIRLNNATTDTELSFSDPQASSGSVPQADFGDGASMLAPAAQGTVIARNNGSCTGTFGLKSGTGLGFAVKYDHPSGPGSTMVTLTPATGYMAGANAETFPGHHSVAKINLYRGVKNGNGAWVVPLGLLNTPAWNNSQDFLNSMYATGVRDVSVIHGAYGDTDAATGLAPMADFTGGQWLRIVDLWQAHWLNAGGGTLVPPDDIKILDLLRSYIDTAASNGPLVLWVPQLRYLPGTEPAAYELRGYRAFPMRDGSGWNSEAVTAFLRLLVSGAHLVAICAARDLPAGVTVQAFDRVLENSGLPTRGHPGNSHYASVVNTTGRYYLTAHDDFAPEDCGLLGALVTGRTVNSTLIGQGAYNSFIQLEGWQAISKRHNADYGSHEKTLWNISTFGASVHSEKRATSVFLAPAGWTPRPYQTTCMMPYVGAYAVSAGQPQGWLRHDLVSVPADAPALPPQFIG
ncbi:MAG: hypothetical protein WBC18_23550 [Ottowia sp.]|uniref:hypothetical protein n=1 Tax=Ottowia sp. TaxID=1898956 RepID=UPI003C77500C